MSRQKPDISPSDALAILRAGLNEDRPANNFDWERLEAVLGTTAKYPPDGSIRAAEYVDKLGISRQNAYVSLAALVKSGQMETGLFRDALNQGRHTRFWWWKNPKSAKKAR